MKKQILIILCMAYFHSQAQMRVKTEDGKTIELRSDGTWTVVGESTTSNNSSPSKTPTPSHTNSNGQEVPHSVQSQTLVHECEQYEYGNFIVNNSSKEKIEFIVRNIIKLGINPNYGVKGANNSEWKKMYEYATIDYTINVGESKTIYFIREGSYQYSARGIEKVHFDDLARGEVNITKCSSINIDIK